MNPEDRFYELKLGDSIPEWAYRQVEQMPKYIGTEYRPVMIPLSKLAGTDHPRYYGRTWLEAMANFKHKKAVTADYVKTINYWVLNKLPKSKTPSDAVSVVYIEDVDKYYISHGNHRLISMKFRGDERICIKNVLFAQLEHPPVPQPSIEIRRDPELTQGEKITLTMLTWIDNLFSRQ